MYTFGGAIGVLSLTASLFLGLMLIGLVLVAPWALLGPVAVLLWLRYTIRWHMKRAKERDAHEAQEAEEAYKAMPTSLD